MKSIKAEALTLLGTVLICAGGKWIAEYTGFPIIGYFGFYLGGMFAATADFEDDDDSDDDGSLQGSPAPLDRGASYA